MASRKRRGKSTAPSASQSTWPRRTRSRSRGGRGRSCSRCPRTCSPSRPTSPTALASSWSGWLRAAGPRTSSRASRQRRASARHRRRRGLDGRDEPRCPGVLRGERPSGRMCVSLPGLRRQSLTELRRRARRRDGRCDRRSPSRADLVLAIGGRSERCRRAATRSSNRRIRGRRSSMSIRPRVSSGASTSQTSRSSRRSPSSRRPCAPSSPVEPRWREWTCRTSRLRGEPPQRADGGRRRSR